MPIRLSTRVTFSIALAVAIGIAAAFAVAHFAAGLDVPAVAAWAVAALVAIPAVLWSAHVVVSRVAELHAVLGNALRAFHDGDFSLRLAARGDREIAELKRLYNDLADTVSADRRALYEKEILLDTILQRTPVAVVLLNPARRVIYSNAAARELLGEGRRIDGRLFDDLVSDARASLRDALSVPSDAIFRADDGGREETFHLTQRVFHLNAQEHRLVLIERLTQELRRQEVEVWKKAIRTINHEINNTVAPISSLFHSARRANETPQYREKLTEIYDLIGERLQYLQSFLESYARFARLPDPRKERSSWGDLLDQVGALYPFRLDGHPPPDGFFDRAQMEQVLINLVKNAHESGSDRGEIVVSIHRAGHDDVVRIFDRGRGMTEEVMRQALVPFYSTKQGGSGLGLALSNEIVEAHGGTMRLDMREGGGTVVTCWLPNRPAAG